MAKIADKQKPRAAGYVRLSVMTEETTSLETQAREIEAYCARQGWVYDPSSDLFEDRNLSGSKKSVRRPQFEELMGSLDRYDRVVVWKLDRFTRRMAELTQSLEVLEESGVALVSVADGIDTSTVSGRTMTGIIGTLADSEARTIAERVRSAQTTMAKSGRWKGGNRPYGWRSQRRPDGDGVRLCLVPDEAAVLRKAVALAKQGEGAGPIAKALNADGHRSPNGNPWSPQAIKRILNSPLLVGWHEFNGVITRGPDGVPLRAHDALITEDEWQKVRTALAQRRIVRPQSDGALLSGVIYCGVCGGRMQGSSSLTNPRANYKCRNRYALNKESCPGTSVRALPVDLLIGEVVLQVLSTARNRQAAMAGLSKQQNVAAKDLRALRTEETSLLLQMETLRDQRSRGVFDYAEGAHDWERDFTLLRDRLNSVRERMASHEVVEPLPVAMLDNWLAAKDIDRMWQSRTNKQRREVVRLLLERVEIMPPNPEWAHRHFDHNRVRLVWRGGIRAAMPGQLGQSDE